MSKANDSENENVTFQSLVSFFSKCEATNILSFSFPCVLCGMTFMNYSQVTESSFMNTYEYIIYKCTYDILALLIKQQIIQCKKHKTEHLVKHVLH